MSKEWHAYPDSSGAWHVLDVHTPPQTATPIPTTVENAWLLAQVPRFQELAEGVVRLHPFCSLRLSERDTRHSDLCKMAQGLLGG